MSSQSDKKEEFRKYLEKGNVLGLLTNILTDLFEMDNKPENPCQYLYQRVGEFLNKNGPPSSDAVPVSAATTNPVEPTPTTNTPATANPATPNNLAANPTVSVTTNVVTPAKDVAMSEAAPVVTQPQAVVLTPTTSAQGDGNGNVAVPAANAPAVPAGAATGAPTQPTPQQAPSTTVPSQVNAPVTSSAPVNVGAPATTTLNHVMHTAGTDAKVETAQQPQAMNVQMPANAAGASNPAEASGQQPMNAPALNTAGSSQPQATVPVTNPAGVPNVQAPVQ